ncbi:hypothetical protein ACQI4L_06935 [Mycolicibacterium litorale]|uniref:hypothetical protein n=1 Tax=Mycolicibacterium litorale TaxID=758802 RepID=UPI003CF79FFA
MFVPIANELADKNPGVADAYAEILTLDPATVSYLMDSAWSHGGPGMLNVATPEVLPVGISYRRAFELDRRAMIWPHLIYAYMIENTRVYEIMGRVITEYTQGERLGILQRDESYQWLRTTEELFYKDYSPVQPFNLVSRIRPDLAATRRNAYYRMFGMDLNHGRDGAAGYPYVKPPVANRDFVVTFEEFLREVWRAMENANNQLAANPTDFPAIQDLATRLQNMLTARRGGAANRPNLAREEFLAVSLAGWLHLSLLFDTPIVQELAATGPSPEERLRQIGERVGLPAHGRSHSYFLIALRVAMLLQMIERGDFSDRKGAESLAAPGPIRDLVAEVIHHWSLISGRNLKSTTPAATSVLSSAAPAPGVTSPAAKPPPLAAAASSNGKVLAGSP